MELLALYFSELTEIMNSGDYNKFLLSFSLVFLVSAIAFKIGVIPFHMWLPDVYEVPHILQHLFHQFLK